MKTYTTTQGDMWDLIALRVYGRETAMAELLKANPAHHAIMVFPAGIKLICPDINRAVSYALPPWRR